MAELSPDVLYVVITLSPILHSKYFRYQLLKPGMMENLRVGNRSEDSYCCC